MQRCRRSLQRRRRGLRGCCLSRRRHAADLGLQAVVAGKTLLGFGDFAADLDVAGERIEQIVARLAALRVTAGGEGQRRGRQR